MHPNQKYYIRQLARDLKLQVNSVRRELENLEQFGLLVSAIGADFVDENHGATGAGEEDDLPAPSNSADRQAGGIKASQKKKLDSASKAKGGQEKKYYKANKNFVLFEEVKALIIKAQILYEKDFINKLKKVGNIKLFVLSGIFVNTPNSAVDLLVVGRFKKDKFLKLVKDLESELGKEINFTLMDTREFKYRKDVTDIFLYDILEGRKIVVVDEIGLS